MCVTMLAGIFAIAGTAAALPPEDELEVDGYVRLGVQYLAAVPSKYIGKITRRAAEDPLGARVEHHQSTSSVDRHDPRTQ